MAAGTRKPSATITSFTVDSPTSNCTVSGILKALCGEHSVESISLTEDAKAKPYDGAFYFRDVNLFTYFESEGEPCLQLEVTDSEKLGTKERASATLDDPAEIGSVMFAGYLEDTLEDQFSMGGQLYAEPAGTYGFE